MNRLKYEQKEKRGTSINKVKSNEKL